MGLWTELGRGSLGSYRKGMLVIMCITPASTSIAKAKTVKSTATLVMNLCIGREPSGSHQSYAFDGRKGFGYGCCGR
jgi:hypothetical protein